MLRRFAFAGLLAAAAAWPFWGPLFEGRVLFFRDVSVTYYPDLVFLERALAQRVWPLWHPGADAGAPFLPAYPVHLALVALAGARATLALSPWLHVLVAMLGAAALARRVSIGPVGSWAAAVTYGLSGWMLGSVLYPVFLAAAWLPLAVALAIDVVSSPRPARCAALGLVLALQLSTLGVEALPQTAFAALVLLPRRPSGRAAAAIAFAVALAALLAAPAIAGAAWLLRGTARGAGFAQDVGLSYSAPGPVLLEALLPRFLGDPHTFGERGFWGQPFFGGATPFFLSLYLGPIALLLAARAGRRASRCWLLVAAGVLLALGGHGPLGGVLPPLMTLMRVPVKFFLLSTLGVALLAGSGAERARGGAWGRAALAPGLLLLLAAAGAFAAPDALAGALAHLLPEAGSPLARYVVATRWPLELALTGALALAAGLALLRGGPLFSAAAVLLLTLDLARVNGTLNPAAPADFYLLREPVRRAVEASRAEGAYRFFSYGAAQSGPLTWRPEIVGRDADVWLYYVDRQSLLPRTQVLDGLEGAFDLDRMGLAPRGSTLALAEAAPEAFRSVRDRLRAANVRWVLSFAPLPEDLVAIREAIAFPEVAEPLRLYELRDALPRAYYVQRIEDALAPAPGAASGVSYEATDPHTVVVRSRTPPGFVVVLDGYDEAWTAANDAGPVTIARAAGRYRAVAVRGGEDTVTFRLQPWWRGPALSAMACGALLAAALGLAPLVSEFTGRRSRPC